MLPAKLTLYNPSTLKLFPTSNDSLATEVPIPTLPNTISPLVGAAIPVYPIEDDPATSNRLVGFVKPTPRLPERIPKVSDVVVGYKTPAADRDKYPMAPVVGAVVVTKPDASVYNAELALTDGRARVVPTLRLPFTSNVKAGAVVPIPTRFPFAVVSRYKFGLPSAELKVVSNMIGSPFPLDPFAERIE